MLRVARGWWDVGAVGMLWPLWLLWLPWLPWQLWLMCQWPGSQKPEARGQWLLLAPAGKLVQNRNAPA